MANAGPFEIGAPRQRPASRRRSLAPAGCRTPAGWSLLFSAVRSGARLMRRQSWSPFSCNQKLAAAPASHGALEHPEDPRVHLALNADDIVAHHDADRVIGRFGGNADLGGARLAPCYDRATLHESHSAQVVSSGWSTHSNPCSSQNLTKRLVRLLPIEIRRFRIAPRPGVAVKSAGFSVALSSRCSRVLAFPARGADSLQRGRATAAPPA